MVGLRMDVWLVIIMLYVLSSRWGNAEATSPDLDRSYSCQGVEMDTDACRCDEECTIYGDCCGPVQQSPSALQFECRSVYIDEPYYGIEFEFVEDRRVWMVESCPPEWNETQTEQDCRNVSIFHPVTDMITGLVYSNDYCATCNSVSGTVYWKYNLMCDSDAILYILETNFTLSTEDLVYHCSPCRYIEPNITSPAGLPAPPPRPCYSSITSCNTSKESLEYFTSQSWTEEQYSELVENCTNGPYGLVREVGNTSLYRNQYCALCNGIIPSSMERASDIMTMDRCMSSDYSGSTSSDYSGSTSVSGQEGLGSGVYPVQPEESRPLSLVLDVFGNGVVVSGSMTHTVLIPVSCSEDEVFDFKRDSCRKALSGNLTINGTHCSDFLIALDSSQYDNIDSNSVTFNGTKYTILSRDPVGRPVVCARVPPCPSYIALTEEDEYEYIENDMIRYNDEEYEIVFWDIQGMPVICTNFLINGTREVNVTVLTYSYPGGFVELTYIGCSFSMLGCALILLTYGLFKELRKLPGKILMNLAATILVSNLFLLLSGLGGDSQDFCIASAIILHLFFLAQFSWMSIMTFEMGRTFNNARKLAPESSKTHKSKLLILYTLIGWGIPAIIVGASVAVNFNTDDLVLYGETEDGEEGSCWINHLESAIVTFLVPVAASILFNAVVFVFVSVWLFKAWKGQTKLNKEQSIPYVRVYLAIVSITGLTWIFGFLAILAGTSWSWYPFIILNSFQGFTIFVLFLLTRKVLNRYLACLTCGRVEISMPSSKRTLERFVTKTNIRLRSTNSSQPDHTVSCPANTEKESHPDQMSPA